MTKETEEVLKRYNEETKRHMGVLTENFKSEVKAIGEQYDSIDKKLNSHTEMIASIKKDIEIMKVDLISLRPL